MSDAVAKTSDVDDDVSNSRKRAAVNESQIDEDEKQKLENRRAYNRQCAAKARKRSKELVAHLQTQVEELTKDKAELKRENDVMKAQLELLENQNKALMVNQIVQQQQQQQQQQGSFSGFPAQNNFLHGSLLNATNSLVSSSTSTSSTSNNSATTLPKLPSSNQNELANLIARLTQQPPPPPPPPQAMPTMGGPDNGQLAALLSLIQAQSDPNAKH